jgi:uncharacterized protein DUF1839
MNALEIDRATYAAHPIHRDSERMWPETNCYVDLWVELLHALRLEPVAAMGFTLALDWEGDQFTFFKFPLEDLEELFGIETLELQIWRPLPEAILTQVRQGRPVIVELDAFHLPDTHGVSYGVEHVKTSVAVSSIDVANRRLGYFHNRGYHELEGRDYAGLFHCEGPADARILPPYVEMVKLHRLRRADSAALARMALAQARKHLSRKPAENPVRAFASSFARDLEWLAREPMASFHAYSFATLRQLGANCECAATFARWLAPRAGLDLEAAAGAFCAVASAAKAMQFRLARVPAGKKYDGAASLRTLAESWEEAMASLSRALG